MKKKRNSIWHATKDAPERDSTIGCVVDLGCKQFGLRSLYYSEKTLFDEETWQSVCEDWHIVKWCYFDELVNL